MEFRLVVNQSVCPCEVESTPKDRSVFPLFAIQGYILLYYVQYIKALSLDAIVFCRYMYDLTSWAHI